MAPGDRCGGPPRRGPIINVQIAPRWPRRHHHNNVVVVQTPPPPPRPAPVVVVQQAPPPPRPAPVVVVQQQPPPPYYQQPPSDGHYHNPTPRN
ncbi:altered inheritance of mitochondria protein 3 [Drosophila novamexicana]|uniref:altered inheritance of mitochondria protein 3 n=1 Tax=Drosophila novamexicana TaxID=47314 RepID=UPI0011E5D49D|nr:altered inheritance of mitochondria protein 3 [Drosophila novamexicana]